MSILSFFFFFKCQAHGGWVPGVTQCKLSCLSLSLSYALLFIRSSDLVYKSCMYFQKSCKHLRLGRAIEAKDRVASRNLLHLM